MVALSANESPNKNNSTISFHAANALRFIWWLVLFLFFSSSFYSTFFFKTSTGCSVCDERSSLVVSRFGGPYHMWNIWIAIERRSSCGVWSWLLGGKTTAFIFALLGQCHSIQIRPISCANFKLQHRSDVRHFKLLINRQWKSVLVTIWLLARDISAVSTICGKRQTNRVALVISPKCFQITIYFYLPVWRRPLSTLNREREIHILIYFCVDTSHSPTDKTAENYFVVKTESMSAWIDIIHKRVQSVQQLDEKLWFISHRFRTYSIIDAAQLIIIVYFAVRMVIRIEWDFKPEVTVSVHFYRRSGRILWRTILTSGQAATEGNFACEFIEKNINFRIRFVGQAFRVPSKVLLFSTYFSIQDSCKLCWNMIFVPSICLCMHYVINGVHWQSVGND